MRSIEEQISFIDDQIGIRKQSAEKACELDLEIEEAEGKLRSLREQRASIDIARMENEVAYLESIRETLATAPREGIYVGM